MVNKLIHVIINQLTMKVGRHHALPCLQAATTWLHHFCQICDRHCYFAWRTLSAV